MLLEAVKIDDPIGAFPVHGAAGMWGVIAEGIFNLEGGVYYGAGADVVLIPNLMGIAAIAGWVVVTCAPFFIILKVTGLLRADLDMEKKGLDFEMVMQRMDSKDATPAVPWNSPNNSTNNSKDSAMHPDCEPVRTRTKSQD